MKISNHISYRESVNSNTATRRGISNVPNKTQLSNMIVLAEKVFEPLRAKFGKPIRINSFFRSQKLNTAIGGSKTSQHTKGEAVDLDALGGITNKQLFDYIRNNLEFDQLIWEFGTDTEPDWIHVSYTSTNKNRKKVLKAYRHNGRTRYKNI